MIEITHFVNPHKFFYKRKKDEGFDKQLDDMEVKIKGTVAKKTQSSDTLEEIEVGDVVGVFMNDWNKWIRGTVKEKHQHGWAHLWANDYGIPIIARVKQLVKLPAVYTKMNAKYQRIHVGGLINLLPAELTYDYDANSMVIREQTQWPTKAIEISQDIIGRAIQLRFDKMDDIKMANDTHNFGQLVVQKTDGKWIALSECLLASQMAKLIIDNWNNHAQRLDTINQKEWKAIDGNNLKTYMVVVPISQQRIAIDMIETPANMQPIKNEVENPLQSLTNMHLVDDTQRNGTKPLLPDATASSRIFKQRSISSCRSVKGAYNYNNASKSMHFNKHQRNGRSSHTAEFPPEWHSNRDLQNHRYRQEVAFFEASFRRENNAKGNSNDDPKKNETGSDENVSIGEKPIKSEPVLRTPEKVSNNGATKDQKPKKADGELQRSGDDKNQGHATGQSSVEHE